MALSPAFQLKRCGRYYLLHVKYDLNGGRDNIFIQPVDIPEYYYISEMCIGSTDGEMSKHFCGGRKWKWKEMNIIMM